MITPGCCDDAGLAFFLGLAAVPKASHLGTYSYRVRRESNQQLLTGLIQHLRPLGLATGNNGFNLDFHAIRHHGDDPVLEAHYVPSRSQRTRSVLTFFASDHASNEMVYANADITKTEQAREIIAFADYWQAATGTNPGLLVFDSQLTTYKVLDELNARGITWLTLRQRGKQELARLQALPASQWKHLTIDRAGRYRHPHLHEDMVTLKGVTAPARQLAIRNIGRDQPTLLITADQVTPAKHLFARYAERMLIETNSTPTFPGSTSTHSRPACHSTSTWTPPSPSSPATSTASSRATCPATSTPPPTPCGDTSWTTPAPCTSPQRASPPTSPCAATIPSSSTPASPTCNYPSPGGTAGPYASASHPADLPRAPPAATRPEHQQHQQTTCHPGPQSNFCTENRC